MAMTRTTSSSSHLPKLQNLNHKRNNLGIPPGSKLDAMSSTSSESEDGDFDSLHGQLGCEPDIRSESVDGDSSSNDDEL